MLKNLRSVWAFLVKDATVAVSYRLDFFLTMFGLFFQVIVLYFASQLVGSHQALDGYGGYLPFATVGIAVLSFFSTSFRSFARAIRKEQVTGTLEAMLMTPTPIPTIVVGTTLWSIGWALMTAFLYIGCLSLMFGFEVKGSLLGASVLLLLLTIFVGSLGIISASFTLVFKRGDPLGFFVGSLSALVGGAIFPVSILPSWVQKISYMHPFTYGLDGVRALLLKGEPLQSVTTEFTILLVCTLVCVPLSFTCFRLALRYARREGTLLQY